MMAAAMVTLAAPTRADFQTGVDAYQKGDYEAALDAWRPLAEAGEAEAQFYLGTLYYHGEGVPQSTADAARWYRRAADQGHAAAQHNLGVMRYAGEGMPQDQREALGWFRRAAERGHGAAQYNLGIMYAEGQGTPQDNVQAYLWFSLAAARNEGHAQEARDFVAGRMTAAQIAEAQELVRAWRPTP